MREKEIERRVGGIWFEFGVYPVTGNVDVANIDGDVFDNVSREVAAKLIAARDRFIAELCAIMPICANPGNHE